MSSQDLGDGTGLKPMESSLPFRSCLGQEQWPGQPAQGEDGQGKGRVARQQQLFLQRKSIRKSVKLDQHIVNQFFKDEDEEILNDFDKMYEFNRYYPTYNIRIILKKLEKQNDQRLSQLKIDKVKKNLSKTNKFNSIKRQLTTQMMNK